MPSVRVLHVGLGPVGLSIVKQISGRAGIKSVAGVDIDPAKAGADLGAVAGLSKRLGVRVSAEVVKTIKTAKPDVAILCTGSSIKTVMPEIEALLKARLPIVSTAEELSYPAYANKRDAQRIDELARKARVAVLGTGVNPGFVMDALPIMLTASCARVERITVVRVQDARVRRLPFQLKIGAGLTIEQFQKQVDNGTVRHVGFTESIAMIGAALGWTLDRITDEVSAKLATATISSEFLAVDPGYVCGIVQDGVGYRKGEPMVRLHMEAYLGAPESYDAIDIEGTPPLSMRMLGGVHGDIATASMVVNSIPKVLGAPPGLHTMRDLPLPSFFAGT
jgi:hypothetical protein